MLGRGFLECWNLLSGLFRARGIEKVKGGRALVEWSGW